MNAASTCTETLENVLVIVVEAEKRVFIDTMTATKAPIYLLPTAGALVGWQTGLMLTFDDIGTFFVSVMRATSFFRLLAS